MSNYKSSTHKFVRRILSRSSSKNKEKARTALMESDNSVEREMEALKEQIENLKAAIGALQEDADKKDVVLAKVVREKEKLHSEYLKVKQSNSKLAQQLKDERRFYFKEKEAYCQEMNEYKKLKRNFSSSNISEEEKKTVQDYKEEIGKLKKTISRTLEVNYNLSIKFLRMKNTKSFLKKELEKHKMQHEKTVADLRHKIETMSADMKDVLDLRIERALTPSSKKYVQLVKQNSSLIYENLCLQLDADRLNLRLGKLNLYKTKSETNSRLKYLKHEHCVPVTEEKPKVKKKRKHVRLDLPEKLNTPPPKPDKPSKPNCKVLNIFDRKEETNTTSENVQPKPEKCDTKVRENLETASEKIKTKRKHRKREKSGDKQHRSRDKEKIASNVNDEKLELFQVSPEVSHSFELNPSTSSVATEVERTNSAPLIMESSKFVQLNHTCTSNERNNNNISNIL